MYDHAQKEKKTKTKTKNKKTKQKRKLENEGSKRGSFLFGSIFITNYDTSSIPLFTLIGNVC
jgi:hypothetical protein